MQLEAYLKLASLGSTQKDTKKAAAGNAAGDTVVTIVVQNAAAVEVEVTTAPKIKVDQRCSCSIASIYAAPQVITQHCQWKYLKSF